MKIRSAIGAAIVIAGIVCAAAVVVGGALLLFRDGHQYAGLLLILGSAAVVGVGSAIFEQGRRAEQAEPADAEFCAPEGGLPQRERA